MNVSLEDDVYGITTLQISQVLLGNSANMRTAEMI